MIKDLRTRLETGDVDRILDGDLDDFIKASLTLRKKEVLAAKQLQITGLIPRFISFPSGLISPV